ncbi:steroid delta-isomerase [Seongchinamella sediminis]|uniref:Steroid delta-isomerase n=1 Tax=Seongchinamella sediminis TaxID=2283635 RepID=A0A3L7E570_9GAMM|nr:nuclear transport factor 2 family protein [Seongchinamella sediminis]RLQ23791.1 steroid delta-isomerase [Seongchinamella sediminis]
MENADKIAVVNKYVEAFDNKDISLIRDMYAADAVVEDPVGSEPYVGIDAIISFYEGAFATGARLTLTGDVRCAGNTVAFPFKVIIGDLTIAPIDVFEFNDAGKVVKMKAYWG